MLTHPIPPHPNPNCCVASNMCSCATNVNTSHPTPPQPRVTMYVAGAQENALFAAFTLGEAILEPTQTQEAIYVTGAQESVMLKNVLSNRSNIGIQIEDSLYFYCMELTRIPGVLSQPSSLQILLNDSDDASSPSPWCRFWRNSTTCVVCFVPNPFQVLLHCNPLISITRCLLQIDHHGTFTQCHPFKEVDKAPSALQPSNVDCPAFMLGNAPFAAFTMAETRLRARRYVRPELTKTHLPNGGEFHGDFSSHGTSQSVKKKPNE